MAATGSRAGIHLDGTTATVAVVHGEETPSVETTHQVTGTSPTDALTKALKLVPATYRTRVTLCTVGVTTTPIDITTAVLTRRGFTDAARLRLPHTRGGSPIAGILGDLDKVASGQLETGLAFTAPTDLIADLYQTAGTRTLEVTTTSAAGHCAEDGTHLCIRHDSVELLLVDRAKTHLSHRYDSPGLGHLLDAVNNNHDRFDRAMAGTGADPLAAAVLQRLLARIFDETRSVLDTHASTPGARTNRILVHGPGAAAHDLPAAAAEAGFRLQSPTRPPGVDAATFDAYCAAATCGADMPYAAFLDTARIAARRREQTARTRTKLSWTLSTYLVTVALGLVGPVTAAIGWQAWSRQQEHHTYQSIAHNPAQRENLQDTQLGFAEHAHDTDTTRFAALLDADATAGVQLTDLTLTNDVLHVTAHGTPATLDAWVRSLRARGPVDVVTVENHSATVTLEGTR